MAPTPHLTIVNLRGEAVGEFQLPAQLVERAVKPALVHQVAVAYAANRRAGTAHTKTRGEVRGGGRKPWKQKGTGRARHGSTRSPIWVGGGAVFGPRSTRNFSERLPAELKRQARAMVVADYLTGGKVMVVEELPGDDKTKTMAALFKALKLAGRRTLVMLTAAEQPRRRALQNLKGIEVMAVRQFNAYDGLRYPRWVMTREGVSELVKLVG